MRKKVRLNVIESDIVEYELDEEEKRMKQQNSKKYLWISSSDKWMKEWKYLKDWFDLTTN